MTPAIAINAMNVRATGKSSTHNSGRARFVHLGLVTRAPGQRTADDGFRDAPAAYAVTGTRVRTRRHGRTADSTRIGRAHVHAPNFRSPPREWSIQRCRA